MQNEKELFHYEVQANAKNSLLLQSCFMLYWKSTYWVLSSVASNSHFCWFQPNSGANAQTAEEQQQEQVSYFWVDENEYLKFGSELGQVSISHQVSLEDDVTENSW